jgi:hypothetical protein
MLDFDPGAVTPVVKGTLGGRLEAVRVAVPADVRIVGERLEWIPVGPDGQWWPDGGNATRVLDAFIKLASERRKERFAAFVRKYGVLGVTPSGLPACGIMRGNADPPQLEEPWQGCAVSWEPIAAYRFYAAGAKAMLYLAAALQRARGREVVSPRDIFSAAGLPVDDRGVWERTTEICRVWQEMSGQTWQEWWEARNGSGVSINLSALDPANIAFNFTYSSDLYGPLQDPTKYAEVQRGKFGYWLTEFWLKRAGLVPTITWTEEFPQLGLSVGAPRDGLFELWPTNSLFRVLAAHLAARVCSSTNMATCSNPNCGTLYFTERRPRSDQPHYCEACRATAPSRRTQRWRNREHTTKSNQEQ